MSQSGYVHLDGVEVVRETEKALLLRTEDWEEWVPKSQIADAGDYEAGDVDCSVSVTEFIARKLGVES